MSDTYLPNMWVYMKLNNNNANNCFLDMLYQRSFGYAQKTKLVWNTVIFTVLSSLKELLIKDTSSLIRLCKKTVFKFYLYLRQICKWKFLNKFFAFSGEDFIVQIYEIYEYRGGETGTWRPALYLAYMTRKNLKKLFPIIESHVHPFATLFRDEFAITRGPNHNQNPHSFETYRSLDHFIVNPKLCFINPESNAYTQSIENALELLQPKFKRIYGTKKLWYRHFFTSSWRVTLQECCPLI